MAATGALLAAVAADSLAQECGQHPTDSRAEGLDDVGVFLSNDADGCGEVHGADGFGEGIAGFDEVLVTQRCSFVREPFAETEKAALRSASGLIAQFAVANPRAVHPLRELTSGLGDVESLKSEQILILHVGLRPVGGPT